MPTQDSELAAIFIEMAEVLVDDYDVIDILTKLMDRCIELLGVSAVGVMLLDAEGELRLAASSSEATRVLELFELQGQQGPSFDAFQTGQPVEHENLQLKSGPWPAFSEMAELAGFRSVFALPLRLRDRTIGALSLFGVEETPVDESNVVMARAFADVATISVIQYQEEFEAERLNRQLGSALKSRIVIEQAVGMLAERMGQDIGDALTRLREYAHDHQKLLTDVAQATVDGTLDPSGWSA
jgi:transcriptional regulator with GAF, ATPase, and Fis domain